jgi:hypothetical protein
MAGIEVNFEDIKQFVVHPVGGYPKCEFHLTEVAERKGISHIKCDRLGTRNLTGDRLAVNKITGPDKQHPRIVSLYFCGPHFEQLILL